MADGVEVGAAKKRPRVTRKVEPILNWPTDTVSIDFHGHPAASKDPRPRPHFPHTLLLFVPGNPGLVHWYVDMLKDLVSELGVGFAARGLSYAGHGLTAEVVDVERWDSKENQQSSEYRDTRIPWTLEGQIQHKLAWMDEIRSEMKQLTNEWTTLQSETTQLPRFIFVSHSIGAYMVQRMCFLRQNEILRNTQLLIHLMPFIRMDAPQPQKTILATIANSQQTVITATKGLSRVFSWMPESWLDASLRNTIQDHHGRKVATTLIRQPTFARNYLELGCEELRDVPTVPDIDIFRLLGKHSDAALLYAGGPDVWGPLHHVEEIEDLQRQGHIPSNIRVTYKDDLRHDFIVQPNMVPVVKDFCVEAIRSVVERDTPYTMSRL